MILYKKDSKGKIREWGISVIGSELHQSSGLSSGKKVIHIKNCTGKNIGKSNETTPEAQALLEMESLINEKLTEGYFKTICEVNSTKVILPMLAKDYKSESHKINWEGDVFIQPKLDGMRCLLTKKDGVISLTSRQGEDIKNMEHIKEALEGIREGLILDGELYAHGLSFQENMKLIKKYRINETEQIKYHVYDIVEDVSYDLRRPRGAKLFADPIYVVESQIIKNEDELKKYHAIYLAQGYEGSIIRHGDAGYHINKRSSNLLKYKDFSDIALEIKDITPNESNPKHGTPHFELNCKKFKAGVKMSHKDREDLLINKSQYIGQIGELRYFELTDELIPRFPVFLGIRLDK